MAEVSQDQFVEYIKGISVLELSQLVKRLESELGVSAAAAAPVMVAGGGGGGARRLRRREDRVHGRPHRSRRQQDQRDQGRPRSDEPRSEGSEGPRRGRAEAGQGRRQQGRGRDHQEEVRGSRREGRGQVATRAFSRPRDRSPAPLIWRGDRDARVFVCTVIVLSAAACSYTVHRSCRRGMSVHGGQRA